MATSKPSLTVAVSPDAEHDLIEIWGDNVELYKDIDHADNYLAYLRTEINKLATNYPDGRAIEGFSDFRFVIARKRKGGQGHYIIFDVDEAQQLVTVLRIYHTRMDIGVRLKREFR
jgi:plasmid stabilization system protein ParE